MSEEDTFKALKKLRYEEVAAKLEQEKDLTAPKKAALLKKYGWTYAEFNDEQARRLLALTQDRIVEKIRKALEGVMDV